MTNISIEKITIIDLLEMCKKGAHNLGAETTQIEVTPYRALEVKPIVIRRDIYLRSSS